MKRNTAVSAGRKKKAGGKARVKVEHSEGPKPAAITLKVTGGSNGKSTFDTGEELLDHTLQRKYMAKRCGALIAAR